MSRRIEGDFDFEFNENNAVELDLTTGESAGYVMVQVELGWLGQPISYLSPNRARELAFSLLDLADLAAMQAGSYDPEHDPFEDLVAAQQLVQSDQL